jgi:hypothetical protein
MDWRSSGNDLPLKGSCNVTNSYKTMPLAQASALAL